MKTTLLEEYSSFHLSTVLNHILGAAIFVSHHPTPQTDFGKDIFGNRHISAIALYFLKQK